MSEPLSAAKADIEHALPPICLNCDTPLIDVHCHRCGQPALVHRTLGDFFHDLLHGVLHFEGKIWRTIPRLIWNPGALTREYIAGRRANYVSPIALFLFGVFLMFAIVRQLDFPISDAGSITIDGKEIRGVAANNAEIDRLTQQRAKRIETGQPTAMLNAEIRNRQEALDAMNALRGVSDEANGERLRSLDMATGVEWVDRLFVHIKSNPSLALYKLQSNAYKFSWILIPLSAPFIWLLFVRGRRFPLYDHAVFVTYSLSFMTLLSTASAIFISLGLASVGWVTALVPPLHFYRQLRGAYQLTPFGAFWRTLLLLVFAMAALTAFAIFLLVAAGN